MPSRPSAAETGPSCITPAPESSGSSSCRAIVPPQSRWYCRARRRTRALRIGRPSSLKPAAPASRSEAISVSSSPSIARVTVARKPTLTAAAARASASSASTSAGVETGGSVLAIARMPQ